MYRKFAKRSYDILFSMLLLFFSFPIMLMVAIIIKLDSKGPVLFKQPRVGYMNKVFYIYKFRTMRLTTQENGRELKDKERLTKVGRIVRKLSLDELPQLWNILEGDMSFIGPRPLLVRYYPYYTDEELRRHDVRPGITGLAQIHGRSHAQWDERFRYDLEYVDNLSLGMDCKVLYLTINKVIKGSNTSSIKPAFLVDFDRYRNYEKRREWDTNQNE